MATVAPVPARLLGLLRVFESIRLARLPPSVLVFLPSAVDVLHEEAGVLVQSTKWGKVAQR